MTSEIPPSEVQSKEQSDRARSSHEDDVNAAEDEENTSALLPDSLLNAISEQRPPTPPPERSGKTHEERFKEKLKHHIRFLEDGQKPIKDVKKGDLSIAVLAKQSRVLPPKANSNSKNWRERWLKGREHAKRKGKKPKYKVNKVERRGYGMCSFMRHED